MASHPPIFVEILLDMTYITAEFQYRMSFLLDNLSCLTIAVKPTRR